MALYNLGVFLAVLVATVFTAVLMHYGFAALGMLPDPSSAKSVTDREFFQVDYTLFLNALFIMMSAGFLWWNREQTNGYEHGDTSSGETMLFWTAIVVFICLIGGWAVGMFMS